MKYKVGDKVRVRKDLEHDKAYHMDGGKEWNTAVDCMIELAGKIVEIERVGDQYKIKGNAYLWTDEMFESVCNQKIVITSDGKQTLARLYEGNKVVKSATAKCSAGDTFDFTIGAKLAYDRLMNEEQEWCVVDRPATKGDYIRLKKKIFSFNKMGDILKVYEGDATSAFVLGIDHPKDTRHPDKKWCYLADQYEVVEPTNKKAKKKKKKFVPHIKDELTHYGNLGEPTNYKDAIGRPLFVGDTVDLFDGDNELYGETPIVKASILPHNKEEAFVMGIQMSCDGKKGTTGEWKIIKKRSFEDVKDGEVVIHGLKYIKTEP